MTLYEDDAMQLRQLLDQLPIYATRLGYRTDSTEAERALGDALFLVAERWSEVKPS